jgi:adenine phosphoribosyltransferase
LRLLLDISAHELGLPSHKEGTMITIEGPRFSTKAESKMFRSWGADVINMSTVPEVVLAREAGICYAAVAMSTDYDCWREAEEAVNISAVLAVFKQNAENVIKLFLNTIPKIKEWECRCREDIKTAVIGGEDAYSTIKSKSLSFVEASSSAGDAPYGKTELSTSSSMISKVLCASRGERSVPDKNNEWLKSKIRTVPHWPKPGIMFRDITTLIQDPEAFSYVIQQFAEHYQHQKIDKIAGIESRGFIFGVALAREMNLPFVLIRKKGKLPAETVSQEYALEYGTDKIEMHKDAVNTGENVLIVDDLIATAGTLKAAVKLIEKLNGRIHGCAVVIELPNLKGRETMQEYNLFSLVQFEGE